MSLKSVVIPVLAAGVVAGVSSLAFSRQRHQRSRRAAPERSRRAPLPGRVEVYSDAVPPAGAAPISAHTPGDVSLPRAFWDAAPELELEREDDVASAQAFPRTSLDQPDAPDADELGNYWLAHATQSWDTQPHSGVDDPAEIAADSMSMISDASRAAASLDLPEAAESLEDVESRRF